MTATATEQLRVAIIGAGAVGGTVGARLIQAGHDVFFIARGATLDALRTNGLRLDSVDGDVLLPTVQATDDPSTVGVVDVVLVTVKSTQVLNVVHSLKPLLGPATAVIPMQNGVEASAQLASVLGDVNVMEGLARVLSELAGPGHIKHVAVTPTMEIGPRSATPADSPARATVVRFAAAINAAGMHAQLPEQMDLALWEKFLFIEPFGSVGAVTRVPMGNMRVVPETRALLNTCMTEIRALAAASGVELGDDVMERTWSRYDALPPQSTASLQRDLMAGRPSEFELQTGSVVFLGRARGVATPAHDVLYAALKPLAKSAT